MDEKARTLCMVLVLCAAPSIATIGCYHSSYGNGGGGDPGSATITIDSPTIGTMVGSSFDITFTVTGWAFPDDGHLHWSLVGGGETPVFDTSPITVTDPGDGVFLLKLVDPSHNPISVQATLTLVGSVVQ